MQGKKSFKKRQVEARRRPTKKGSLPSKRRNLIGRMPHFTEHKITGEAKGSREGGETSRICVEKRKRGHGGGGVRGVLSGE